MNVLRILLITVGLFFLSSMLSAQSILLRIADNHMKQLRYMDAVEMYEKVLERHPENIQSKMSLAEAYRRMNNTQSAEYWYSQAVLSPEIDPINHLYYAQMLQKNGKCPLAKAWFKKYATAFPDDIRGQLLSRSCDYQSELMSKNADLYKVRRLWFNSAGDDFSPVFYKDGLAFSSERHEDQFTRRSAAWNDQPFLNLFTVRMAPTEVNVSTECNYIYTEPIMMKEPITSKFHEGSAVFSADEKEVFITKSGVVEEGFMAKGSNYLQLFYARKIRGEWTEPESLPFNGDQYSIAHPAISPDGKYLYFSSNMPGGYGGMDLYRVERIQNRWGDVINLGRQINTEGNEVFPSSDHSGRLFFASDGQIGLGGLDIYVSEEIQENNWSIPENMGYPINTISDDFGIIFNNEGTCGYFSSNRPGGKGGDDIYNFVKQSAVMQVLVYEERTGQPITSAIVEDTCSKQTFRTNASGKIVFDMLLNRCCSFSASMDGFDSRTIEGCTDNLTPGGEVYVEISLRRKLVFSITGIVFDQYTGLPLDNSKVELLSDCEERAILSATTDASGRFTFPLREQCCYSIQATHGEYRGTIQEDYCTKVDFSKKFIAKIYLSPRVN